MKSFRLSAALIAMLTLATLAWSSPKPKEKESAGKFVDSGSFGVFMGTHRVGTETFSISQDQNGSAIHSEFKTEGPGEPAAQTSDLLLTANGEIRRYDWKEVSPGKAQSTVLPNEDFLNERWSANPQEKPADQPFLLPPSTNILDDYFFVHREVLAWKFFATTCKQDKGQLQCPLKQHTQMGTLNPHQRSSAPVTMEFLGREKVSIRGSERDLLKIGMKFENNDWQLWLDDQLKLQRISVPGDNTEVVRD